MGTPQLVWIPFTANNNEAHSQVPRWALTSCPDKVRWDWRDLASNTWKDALAGPWIPSVGACRH